MTKYFVSHASYLRNHTSYDCHLCHLSYVFFNFKILIFRFVRGLKGQKITQNDKSFCRSHFIFQNHISYDLHLWYHRTIIRTEITCKKIPCHMRDSACRWLTVKNIKIFQSYVKYFLNFPT